MEDSGNMSVDGVNPHDRFRPPSDPRRSQAEQVFGVVNQAQAVVDSQPNIGPRNSSEAATISPAEQQILNEIVANFPKPDIDALTAEARSRLLLDGCLTALMKTSLTATAIYSFIVASGTLIQHGEPKRAMLYSGLGLLSLIGRNIAQRSFEAKRDNVIEQITHTLDQ